jgi:glutamate synthase (ferredoxin)
MDNFRNQEVFPKQGLYNPEFEHDNCGIGSVVNIKGEKSRYVLDSALKIVENLEHRAGKDAEGKTGDGVGILTQISHKFFSQEAANAGISIGDERDYGIGMFFFPQNEELRNKAVKTFEDALKEENLNLIWWRKVPTNPDILGSRALESLPYIMQGFIARPDDCEKGLDFDRKLFISRKIFEKNNKDTYVCSCSSRTIAYKGMFLVNELRAFYLDLQAENYETAIATVHSRFSTNTNPSWQKAHPNRIIVHNGEINTITGNADKMLARQPYVASDKIAGEMEKVFPIIDKNGSDSARLDNALEYMVMCGVDLPLAVMACIPEPWKNNQYMKQEKRDLYHYYATMMEPWDGPASIIFSDGDKMGAVLDRNGLRPSRYCITKDGFLILSSEVGALDVPAENILKKERLHPGKMLLVDTVKGKLIEDDEIKNYYAKRHPYGEWLDKNLVTLQSIPSAHRATKHYQHDELLRRQKLFGYSYEDIKSCILPLAQSGSEPIAAMGSDRPLPSLSEQEPPLFAYFRQLFAQVTNPPIDAIREEVVTDTAVYAGCTGNILEEKPENCRVLQIENPILTNLDIMKIKNYKNSDFKVAVLPITFRKGTKLEDAMQQLFEAADFEYKSGTNIIVLTDRDSDVHTYAIPSLLAVSGLHNHLVSNGWSSVSIILESAEPRSIHHFATLLGFGAVAVNPYLALDTIWDLIDRDILDREYVEAEETYCKGILSGIVKIASKMGISTIQSYQGAKIFEAIGIDESVIDKYFTGTVSRVGGINIEDIEKRTIKLHSTAFDPFAQDAHPVLESSGRHKERSNKEEHIYNPETIHLLQLATRNGDYEMFKQYSKCINREDRHITLRSLLDIKYPERGIPITEVESVESIVKRFKTGAMSYGSISQEAHECMAVAMNRLGGKSNSGEGGETPERLLSAGSDTDKCSAIKQVASGRFGVTSEYLVSAKEIQIKMAQGAKPGEGGHLPSGKVYPWVAKTRHSTPGVGLISPPPHHDIYSIEDLAQLIYDLKNANKKARISVKLVSEVGVGTVAAGVAKAGAEVVLVSGFDGGTGAAPLNSIYNAGLPWELGVAEAHQTLMLNGLRSKVVVETDGKLMTGRDVLVAALLGAEEFGFATAPLVTMGCVMMRVCNLDTCPVGVATQNPELRKRFKGKPEYVMNFMLFVAQELREYMAKLGIRTVDELVGRTDLLYVRDIEKEDKGSNINFSRILENKFLDTDNRQTFNPDDRYDFKLENTIDEKVIMKSLSDAFENGESKEITIDVTNTDRTVGTIFGSEITRKYGSSLEEDFYKVNCKGSGGQSFGAFIPKGLTLTLEGDSNDYFGKGLSGGKLVVYPPKESTFNPEDNIIIGNVALYGATSGKAFINGIAGERFCVRNSGATAGGEGVGDHGCEYMTGGRVVVLGSFGKNFAAGMSGGIAYVLDENDTLYKTMNKGLATYNDVIDDNDAKELREMITEHYEATGSPKAKLVLDNFEEYLPKFKKVLPYDYARMLKTISEMKAKGMSDDEAQIEAFYANTRK